MDRENPFSLYFHLVQNMYARTYTLAHKHAHTHTRMRTHTHARTHAHTYTHTRALAHTHIHAHAHTHMLTKCLRVVFQIHQVQGQLIGDH